MKQEKFGITLANEKLIEDIQYLLLQIGILSRKLERPNNKSGAWALHIDSGCVKEFSDNIPLLLKGEKLQEVANKDRYSLLDIYPNKVKKFYTNVER